MKRSQIMQDLFGEQSEEESEDIQRSTHENEGNSKTQGEPELESGDVPKSVDHHQSSSRLRNDGKDMEQALLFAAAMREIFGDFDDDEQEEHAVHTQINQEDNRPPEDKRSRVKELTQGVILPDKAKLQGRAVAPPLVFEIPLRPPPAHPDQMATLKSSNIIGIDSKPFDPSTYVEEDFYVTNMSGSRRRIPPANIIRWRKVTNPDATTSVESNARFVKWSDGSLQLLIGSEAFDVFEQDIKDMQSHLFVRHKKGILCAQGQISKKLKFMPSSLSSNSHLKLTAQVNSQNTKVNKVKHCSTDVDPEWVIEQMQKAERQKTKASKNKKKLTRNYTSKGRKERQISTGFLKDIIDEEPQNSTVLRHFEDEGAQKHIMNEKKERKATHHLASSTSKSTQRPFYSSKTDKVELEFRLKGKNVECSQSPMGIEETHKGEAEEAAEDAEISCEKQDFHQGPKARNEESGGTFKKQYIESDEDSPPRRTITRHRRAIVYDSDDE